MATRNLRAAPRRPIAIPKALSPEEQRTQRYATLLLRAIRSELADADFFTREDLIQMKVFSHVSTITRYHEVCLAIQALLRRGDVLAQSRTDLCLPERAGRYRAKDKETVSEYRNTIQRICIGPLLDEVFGVMDVVHAWTTDQHLTINAKRVAVRGMLKTLVREKRLKSMSDFAYSLNQ